LQILIAGPYRSGTNDDPQRIAENVRLMSSYAIQVFRMGHLPVMGEWYALPLIETAGSQALGDAIFNEIFHPVAVRLIPFCDGILRVGGASAGADEMVKTGRELGKAIYFSLEEIPVLTLRSITLTAPNPG
jgi:hypothetical protein